MSGTIEEAFVKQFEAEVAEAYQRQGSKLRPTVRSKTGVKGASTIFPRVGKGTAAAKARNGAVPVMNLTYSNAECFLQDVGELGGVRGAEDDDVVELAFLG